MTEASLILEAEKRGYRTGTIIDYGGMLKGTDTLGNGEFAVVDGKLVKYETAKRPGENPFNRRYDTIWTERNGWTKIVN